MLQMTVLYDTLIIAVVLLHLILARSLKVNANKAKDFVNEEYNNIVTSSKDEYHCPYPCVCQLSEAFCDGMEVESIPFNLPADLTKLNFKNNKITKVKEKHIAHLSKLKSLNLRGNHIKYIEPGVFKSMKELESLTFRDNFIKKVNRLTFQGLNSLEQLSIRNNRLKEIERAFEGLHHLELLSLGENHIRYISSKTFASNGRLRVLDLHNNSITFIHKDSFVNLHMLRYLILRDNPIKVVDLNFKQNFHLELLDLTNCKLKEMVQGLPSSIRDLRVAENEIKSLVPQDFHRTQRIRLLVLNLNQLKHIHNETFTKLHSLIELDISNNSLTALPQNLPLTLTKLSCGNNSIAELNEGDFLNNLNLEKLFLSHNRIAYIDKNAFQQLVKLKSLDLSYNDINFLPPLMFQRAQNLEHLDLSRNPIKEAEHNCFKGLESLHILEISSVGANSHFQATVFKDTRHLLYLDISNSSSIARHLTENTYLLKFISTVQDLNLMHNSLYSLPESFARYLPNLKSLKLVGNPWHCDASIYWMTTWLQNHTVNFFEADHILCASPPRLKGRRVDSLLLKELPTATPPFIDFIPNVEIVDIEFQHNNTLVPTLPYDTWSKQGPFVKQIPYRYPDDVIAKDPRPTTDKNFGISQNNVDTSITTIYSRFKQKHEGSKTTESYGNSQRTAAIDMFTQQQTSAPVTRHMQTPLRRRHTKHPTTLIKTSTSPMTTTKSTSTTPTVTTTMPIKTTTVMPTAITSTTSTTTTQTSNTTSVTVTDKTTITDKTSTLATNTQKSTTSSSKEMPRQRKPTTMKSMFAVYFTDTESTTQTEFNASSTILTLSTSEPRLTDKTMSTLVSTASTTHKFTTTTTTQQSTTAQISSTTSETILPSTAKPDQRKPTSIKSLFAVYFTDALSTPQTQFNATNTTVTPSKSKAMSTTTQRPTTTEQSTTLQPKSTSTSKSKQRQPTTMKSLFAVYFTDSVSTTQTQYNATYTTAFTLSTSEPIPNKTSPKSTTEMSSTTETLFAMPKVPVETSTTSQNTPTPKTPDGTSPTLMTPIPTATIIETQKQNRTGDTTESVNQSAKHAGTWTPRGAKYEPTLTGESHGPTFHLDKFHPHTADYNQTNHYPWVQLKEKLQRPITNNEPFGAQQLPHHQQHGHHDRNYNNKPFQQNWSRDELGGPFSSLKNQDFSNVNTRMHAYERSGDGIDNFSAMNNKQFVDKERTVNDNRNGYQPSHNERTWQTLDAQTELGNNNPKETRLSDFNNNWYTHQKPGLTGVSANSELRLRHTAQIQTSDNTNSRFAKRSSYSAIDAAIDPIGDISIEVIEPGSGEDDTV